MYPNCFQAFSGAVFITSIVNLFLMLNTYHKVREKSIGIGTVIAVVLLFLPLIGFSIILLIPFYVFSIIQYLKMRKMKTEQIASDDLSQLITGIKEKRKNEIKQYVRKYKLFKFSYSFIFFAICIAFVICSASTGLHGIVLAIANVLMIITWVIYTFLEQRIYKKIDVYSEKCDPELFLGIYSELELSEDSVFQILYLKLYQCSGLYGMGKFDEAITELLNMDIKKFRPVFLVFHYYNLLFKSYLELGKVDDSLHVKQQFESLKNDKRFRIYNVSFRIYNISISQYLLIFDAFGEFAVKDYDKATVHFDDLIKNAASPAQAVIYRYYSALIDLEMDRPESAKEKLKYAAENGNNLYFSYQAKEKLKTL